MEPIEGVIRRNSKPYNTTPASNNSNPVQHIAGPNGEPGVVAFADGRVEPAPTVTGQSEEQIRNGANVTFIDSSGKSKTVNLYDYFNLGESSLNNSEKFHFIKTVKDSGLCEEAATAYYVQAVKISEIKNQQWINNQMKDVYSEYLDTPESKEYKKFLYQYAMEQGIVEVKRGYDPNLQDWYYYINFNPMSKSINSAAYKCTEDGTLASSDYEKLIKLINDDIFTSQNESVDRDIKMVERQIEIIKYYTNDYFKNANYGGPDSLGLNFEEIEELDYNLTQYQYEKTGKLTTLMIDGLACVEHIVAEKFKGKTPSAEELQRLAMLYPELSEEFDIYMYGTETQKSMYHYLMKTQGYGAAHDYITLDIDTINRNKATVEAFTFINSLERDKDGNIKDKNVTNHLKSLIKGEFDGFAEWSEHMDNILSADGLPSATDYQISIIMNYLMQSGKSNLVDTYKIGRKVGQKIPLIATSINLDILSVIPGVGALSPWILGAMAGLESYGATLDANLLEYGDKARLLALSQGVTSGFWTIFMKKLMPGINGLSSSSKFGSFFASLPKHFINTISKDFANKLTTEIIDSIQYNKPVDFLKIVHESKSGETIGQALLTAFSLAVASGVCSQIVVCTTATGAQKMVSLGVDSAIEWMDENDVSFDTITEQDYNRMIEEIGVPKVA